MRFLKVKIQRAQQAQEKKALSCQSQTSESDFSIKKEEEIAFTQDSSSPSEASYKTSAVKSTKKNPKKTNTKESSKKSRARINEPDRPLTGNLRATKNIVINFGKAIASFAASHLVTPYMKPTLDQLGLTNKDFSEFVTEAKAKIGGIDSFRTMLMPEDKDSGKRKLLKQAFTFAAEVFMKYFSVNWIIHGRVTHKLTYLKYRHKVLRRIQNPNMFTYISDTRKKI